MKVNVVKFCMMLLVVEYSFVTYRSYGATFSPPLGQVFLWGSFS